jgi:hypothetical protein
VSLETFERDQARRDSGGDQGVPAWPQEQRAGAGPQAPPLGASPGGQDIARLPTAAGGDTEDAELQRALAASLLEAQAAAAGASGSEAAGGAAVKEGPSEYEQQLQQALQASMMDVDGAGSQPREEEKAAAAVGQGRGGAEDTEEVEVVRAVEGCASAAASPEPVRLLKLLEEDEWQQHLQQQQGSGAGEPPPTAARAGALASSGPGSSRPGPGGVPAPGGHAGPRRVQQAPRPCVAAAEAACAGSPLQAQHARYQLAGVVRHIGESAGYGHYVADVLHAAAAPGGVSGAGGGSTGTSGTSSAGGIWHTFDDKHVRRTLLAVVQQGAQQQGYLLAYWHSPQQAEG